jgi:hypothetical protein
VFATIVTLAIGATVIFSSPRVPISDLKTSDTVTRNGLSAGALVDRPETAFTPISVAVTAPAGLSESLLERIFAEAAAIWEPVGITFDWHPIASTETPRGWRLSLTIENQNGRLVEWRAPLGWLSFAADSPDCWIHLSQPSAEELVHRTPTALDIMFSVHERLVGRALGRAFSHELGHYVLKSKAHTPRGLMRATWPSEQLLSVDRGGFELSPEQQEAARHWIRQVPLTCHLQL